MKQLNIDGSTYENDLNDLNMKEWMSFLPVCSTKIASKQDMINFQANESKPTEAIIDLVTFFSKAGDEVLDVFSAEGHSSTVITELGRSVTSIEADTTKMSTHKSSIVSDMFLDTEATLINKEVLEALESLDKKFSFIFIDPPFIKKISDDSYDLGNKEPTVFAKQLADVIDAASFLVNEGRFIAVAVSDYYRKGTYYPIIGLVTERVSLLSLTGLKIYYREVTPSGIGAGQHYAPVQNHFYVMLFKKV